MSTVILMLLGVTAVAVLFLVILTRAMQKSRPASVGQYEVYTVSDGRLTIFAGLPVTYDIDDIEDVTFSWNWYRSRLRIVMKIRFNNGKGSRRYYIFRNSINGEMFGRGYSAEGREETVQHLMDGLEQHGIACVRKQ